MQEQTFEATNEAPGKREFKINLIDIQKNVSEKIQEYLPDKEELSVKQQNAISACTKSIKYLQEDSVIELTSSIKVSSDIDSLKNRYPLLKENLNTFLEIHLIKKLSSYLNPERIVFLLVSNTFNRLDKLGENAISTNKKSTKDAIGEGFLEKVLEKAKLSEYTDSNGQEKKANFHQMIGFIKELASLWEIDTSNWNNDITKIIEAQSVGMNLVAESRQSGKITYSVEKAIKYRKNTIKTHAQLLSNIVYKKPKNKQTFIETIMNRQRGDDEIDLILDQNSQVNPFLALLEKHNLLNGFIEYAKKINRINKKGQIDRVAFSLYSAHLQTKQNNDPKKGYVHLLKEINSVGLMYLN